jgi:hypothetical protein
LFRAYFQAYSKLFPDWYALLFRSRASQLTQPRWCFLVTLFNLQGTFERGRLEFSLCRLPAVSPVSLARQEIALYSKTPRPLGRYASIAKPYRFVNSFLFIFYFIFVFPRGPLPIPC